MFWKRPHRRQLTPRLKRSILIGACQLERINTVRFGTAHKHVKLLEGNTAALSCRLKELKVVPAQDRIATKSCEQILRTPSPLMTYNDPFATTQPCHYAIESRQQAQKLPSMLRRISFSLTPHFGCQHGLGSYKIQYPAANVRHQCATDVAATPHKQQR